MTLQPSLDVLLRINPGLKEHTALFSEKVYPVDRNAYCAVGQGPANTIVFPPHLAQGKPYLREYYRTVKQSGRGNPVPGKLWSEI